MPHFSKLIFLLLVIAGCNQTVQQKSTDEDTLHKPTDSVVKNSNSLPPINADTVLLKLSEEILNHLKTRNFTQLASLINPASGIRFSPYGYIDTAHDQVLSAKQLSDLAQNQQIINWGKFDGTGDPISLTLNKYFEKFVYDVDFLNAKKKSVNHSSGPGNIPKKLQAIYPACDFTEFYFPGFDPKYDGMDWKALRLVFKKEKGVTYLVAIIHDQSTV